MNDQSTDSLTPQSAENSQQNALAELQALKPFREFLAEIWRLRQAQQKWYFARSPRTLALKLGLEKQVDEWLDTAQKTINFQAELDPAELSGITLPY